MPEVHRIGFTLLSKGEPASREQYRAKYVAQLTGYLDITDLRSILLLHGLRGHPRRTWEDDPAENDQSVGPSDKRKSLRAMFKKKLSLSPADSSDADSTHDTVYWPADYLVDDVPKARVWAYGYNADVIGVFEASSKNSVSQHGLDLAARIEREIDNNAPAQEAKHRYAVPRQAVPTFTQREELWNEVEEKMSRKHVDAGVPHAVAICGLGGAGKSQLALKYAERHRSQYDPVLWIDATDEESVRSSFSRCAVELGLSVEQTEGPGSGVANHGAAQAVLRWLRDRNHGSDKWLAIFDNADDFTWGLKDVIPIGLRGSVMITSRDNQSPMLVPGGCEAVQVGPMSPLEGTTLLLRHLQMLPEIAPQSIRQSCDEVGENLGYLALAIDLAGAYISQDSNPEQGLRQYLTDYRRHKNELLRMNNFQGLRPSEKTVWTVWDTTLRKIAQDHADLQPEALLRLLACFKGKIIQDEMFRLAALGINRGFYEELPSELKQFVTLDGGDWDSFQFRRTRDVLLRYSLLQRAGETSVTIHDLVQWRALQNCVEGACRWHYLVFIHAACCQMWSFQQDPVFRRHLIVHLPEVSQMDDFENMATEEQRDEICIMLAKIYSDEGRLPEAEALGLRVVEKRTMRLGQDHPDTLTSMFHLAWTYWEQGRYDDAEKLNLLVVEFRTKKLGPDHEDTIQSIASLASTYWNQGRYNDAGKLGLKVVESRTTRLGVDHPDTLNSINNLATIYNDQGRYNEAEKLHLRVVESHTTRLGADHPDTLTSMNNLGLTFTSQGRYNEAEKLQLGVLESRTTRLGADHPLLESRTAKLGADHPDTLTSMNNLAMIYTSQGRDDEAEKLQLRVIESRMTRLEAGHPDTVTSMNNLGLTYSYQGRYNEAEKLRLQVVESYTTRLGADHPYTLVGRHNLSYTWKHQGRHADALRLMRDCLEARRRVLGEEHPDTLRSLQAVKKWSA
ncbi:TPR-like protein [Thozetella sp. PMI_491]|nr:TPR-like protein [Thozetella sp. PMI_491]